MNDRQVSTGRVAGKIALITGAASGVGKATAVLFADEGAKVALCDLNEEGARTAAEQIASRGGAAESYHLDVTSSHDWELVVAEVVKRWNRLDILVNNAGISFAKQLSEMSLSDWRNVLAVNLDGVFLGTKHGVSAMRQNGSGCIVNVSSASGIKPSAGASAYCASKAAVQMFSRAVALECAQNGDHIRVNTISPSGVMTPMWESMDFWQDLKDKSGSVEAAWEAISKEVPLKRFAEPEEIARAILYLASDESSFVTAANLVIDGGYTAM